MRLAWNPFASTNHIDTMNGAVLVLIVSPDMFDALGDEFDIVALEHVEPAIVDRRALGHRRIVRNHLGPQIRPLGQFARAYRRSMRPEIVIAFEMRTPSPPRSASIRSAGMRDRRNASQAARETICCSPGYCETPIDAPR